jgi:hypothetical protein
MRAFKSSVHYREELADVGIRAGALETIEGAVDRSPHRGVTDHEPERGRLRDGRIRYVLEPVDDRVVRDDGLGSEGVVGDPASAQDYRYGTEATHDSLHVRATHSTIPARGSCGQGGAALP